MVDKNLKVMVLVQNIKDMVLISESKLRVKSTGVITYVQRRRTKMLYGYARVSTRLQAKDGNSLIDQKKKLLEQGVPENNIFVDSFTGTKMKRPELDKLLACLQTGDKLIVCKLDRFARSVSQATELITELIDRGITVHVLNLGVLSNDSVNTLMRNILLAFAQFERDMIVHRTSEGKAVAKQREDYHEGRPKKFSDDQIRYALQLLESNSYSKVVAITGISKATLVRAKQKRPS